MSAQFRVLCFVLLVLANSAMCQKPYVGTADLDGNGVVSATDVLILHQQWGTNGSASLDSVLPQNRNVPSSLHYTAVGMGTFYKAPDGFGALTGVDYDTLACKNCHIQNCASCHDQANGTYNAKTSCMVKCHSRQNTETNTLRLTDVHYTKGMSCSDCHSTEQMHGNGTVYESMLQQGSPDIACANCHIVTATSSVPEHQMHLDNNGRKITCQACHLQSVITCYNCHFDSEVNGLGKVNYGPQKNFIMLVNNQNNEVTTASYQSLYHAATDKSFVVFAPFHSHSVTGSGRHCNDCHNNKYAQARIGGGDIVVTQWVSGAIKHATGVIPVAATNMQFQFVNLTNPGVPPAQRIWQPVKQTADGVQFGYCTPLNAAQLNILSIPMGGK